MEMITLNEDVVTAICERLSVTDIKNCRLLSKLWNTGATRVLKGKIIIQFNIQFVPEDISRNLRYLEEMQNFGAPLNVLINVNVPKSIPRDPHESLESALLGNNHEFFTKYLTAQHYKITGTIYTSRELNFVQDLLLNSNSILSELELNLHYFPHLFRENFLSGKVFRSTKKLVLNSIVLDSKCNIYKNLFESFPNLTNLAVNEAAILDQFRGNPSFPRSINTLTATGTLTGRLLQLLQSFPHPLKELNLNEVHMDSIIKPDDPDPAIEIFNFLSKHAETLQSLSITFKLCRNLPAKLPKFPNLKNLFISMPTSFKIISVIGGVEFDSVDLKAGFPNLERLACSIHIQKGNWTNSFDFMFPEVEMICVSVKHVELEVIAINDSNLFELDSLKMIGVGTTKRVTRLLTMFPNARNYFMTKLVEKVEAEAK